MSARVFRKGYGWPVDLARDRQANCAGCGAAIYWVRITKKDGSEKTLPLSEALTKRDPVSGQVYMGGHHADCPSAELFGGHRKGMASDGADS